MSVILPALPPESQTFNMPDSLRPEDRAFLIRELGKISGELAVKEERIKQLEAWRTKVDNAADASGEQRALVLQAELDKRDAAALVWRGRVWSIVAAVFTTGLLALIAHYLATR